VNSAATLGSLDSDCVVDSSEDCEDYSSKLEELSKLIEESKPKLDAMHRMATEIQAIKMVAKPVEEKEPDYYQKETSAKMQEAMAYARKMSEEKGFDSPEARVAWTEVEDIAASGLSRAMGKRLDEECLVETAMEACQAIDELNRVMTLEKTRGDGGLNS
jgi:CP12 domain